VSSSHLHRDIARLTDALAAAVTQLGGDAAYAVCGRRLSLAGRSCAAAG